MFGDSAVSKKYIGYLALAMATVLVIILIFAAAKQDMAVSKREGIASLLPDAIAPMERVGSVKQGRRNVSLWVFEFEGRRCLWATYTKNSGLTCWKTDGDKWE